MTTKINYYNGYVWFDGKLQSYEFQHADATKDSVIHHCLIGGVDKVIEHDFNVYESPRNYEQNVAITKTCIDWARANQCTSVGDRTFSHTIVDGKVKMVEIDSVTITKELCVKPRYEGALYRYQDEAELYCEYDIVGNDGKVVHQDSVAKQRAFTKEQEEIIGKLQNIITEAENKGVLLVYDMGRDKIVAFNNADQKAYVDYDNNGRDISFLGKEIDCFMQRCDCEYCVRIDEE